MANFKFVTGAGRFREFNDRVANNDPSTSGLVLVAINTSETDATLQDLNTLAAVLANGSTDEFDGTGYARIVLDDTDLTASTEDDVNNRVDLDVADQVFSSVSADGSVASITDIVLCYAPNTGGADSTFIPLGCYDFVVTPNGGNINLQVNAQGYATCPAT